MKYSSLDIELNDLLYFCNMVLARPLPSTHFSMNEKTIKKSNTIDIKDIKVRSAARRKKSFRLSSDQFLEQE